MLMNLILSCIVLTSSAAIVYVTDYVLKFQLSPEGEAEPSPSERVVTLLWTAAVIIVGNLSIFILTPILNEQIEVPTDWSTRDTRMVRQLLAFQIINSLAASLSFLWTKQPGQGLGPGAFGEALPGTHPMTPHP